MNPALAPEVTRWV